MAFARRLFAGAFPDLDRLLDAFVHARIRKRHLCMPPDWYERPRSFAEKNRHYVEWAVRLTREAAWRCLDAAGVSPRDVDAILFVSSTGVAAPSLDARLLNELGLRPDVVRIPLWGLGCAGGAMGLSRAFDYAVAYPTSRVLLVAVELCSLTFVPQDRSKRNLIATALFADGAAAVLVGGDAAAPAQGNHAPRPAIVGRASVTWPNTLDMMGWSLTDDGLNVIFSPNIPERISRHFAEPTRVFLARFGLTTRDLTHVLAHPGGVKVLDALQEAPLFHWPGGGGDLARDGSALVVAVDAGPFPPGPGGTILVHGQPWTVLEHTRNCRAGSRSCPARALPLAPPSQLLDCRRGAFRSPVDVWRAVHRHALPLASPVAHLARPHPIGRSGPPRRRPRSSINTKKGPARTLIPFPRGP